MDTEYEAFLLEVRNLIVPIMETVQNYGLKRRHLLKFEQQVDIFYRKVIVDKKCKSDLVVTYQKRFIRYKDSLFTFLTEDGIPWHNNTAERAIRPFAIQRDVSKSPFHDSTTHAYLTLLSIRQTCRFQGKSFFKFLFSGVGIFVEKAGERSDRLMTRFRRKFNARHEVTVIFHLIPVPRPKVRDTTSDRTSLHSSHR